MTVAYSTPPPVPVCGSRHPYSSDSRGDDETLRQTPWQETLESDHRSRTNLDAESSEPNRKKVLKRYCIESFLGGLIHTLYAKEIETKEMVRDVFFFFLL